MDIREARGVVRVSMCYSTSTTPLGVYTVSTKFNGESSKKSGTPAEPLTGDQRFAGSLTLLGNDGLVDTQKTKLVATLAFAKLFRSGEKEDFHSMREHFRSLYNGLHHERNTNVSIHKCCIDIYNLDCFDFTYLHTKSGIESSHMLSVNIVLLEPSAFISTICPYG